MVFLHRILTQSWPVLLAILGLAAPALGWGADTEAEPVLKVPQINRDPKPIFTPTEYPMPSDSAPGAFQMRCWQRGQLLFSENNLSEPAVSALPGRVATFNEKTGNAVYLVEVADSLCLIKRNKAAR